MKIKIKILQFITAIWLLLIIFRFERLIEISGLLINYIVLCSKDLNGALGEFEFRTIDTFLSLIIYLSIPVLLLFYRHSLKYLNSAVNFSSAIIILLFVSLLMAPIITGINPEFQKNLNVTKHLSPLSSVNVLHLKSESKNEPSPLERFRIYKKEIISQSFDDNIIFADSVGEFQEGKLIYFQKNLAKEIYIDALLTQDGIPLLTTQTFFLGTDEFGRDTFTRLIYGLRVSMLVGFGAVLISFLLGITLGFIAGYKGGLTDLLLNRVSELFLTFPVIYLVILILALFSSSFFSVIVVLGISGWMSLFKIVRGETISLKQKDYMLTAKLLGLNLMQLLFKEFLPVVIIPVIVNLIYQFSNVILAESALSYLGLSIEAGYPSWGAMIQSGQEYITKAWWMIVFPGSCLVITLFAFNDVGRKITKIINPRLDV